MSVTLSDIIHIMEEIAPPSLVETWDNSGLQVGKKDWPAKKIWVSLDATPSIVAAACNKDVNLLITHHPLIFHPISSIDLSTPLGRILQMSIQHNLAILSAHTNLDKATGGVNDILADRIGLTNLRPFQKNELQDLPDNKGFGRIGCLTKGTTLELLADGMKKKLGLKNVRFVGRRELFVEHIAICSGSGSSLLGDFLSSDASVYISGDFKYHDARIVEEYDRGIIDIGHFGSEYIIVKALVDQLQEKLTALGHEIEISMYENEKDPFIVI